MNHSNRSMQCRTVLSERFNRQLLRVIAFLADSDPDRPPIAVEPRSFLVLA